MTQYREAEDTNKEPRLFEVIDNIYKLEYKEMQTKIKDDSPQKLQLLNSYIDDRIQKGVDVLNVKHTEQEEEFEGKQ